MSLLGISETLGLFVNTLTANDQYSLLNKKNLQQPVRNQLLLINYLAPFLKTTPHFEHFESSVFCCAFGQLFKSQEKNPSRFLCIPIFNDF